MIKIEPTPEIKTMIAERAHLLPAHTRPVWTAVRDYDCTYFAVQQSVERFAVSADRGTIAVFGDDLGYGTAKGPNGFDRASLGAYLAQCRTIVLVTSEAVPMMYGLAAVVAVALRCCTAVIESLPEKETEWLAFISEHAAHVPLSLCTVEGQGGVH